MELQCTFAIHTRVIKFMNDVAVSINIQQFITRKGVIKIKDGSSPES